MDSLIPSKEEQELEKNFAKVNLRRSEFLKDGKPKKANKEYLKLYAMFKGKVRKLPDRGEAILTRLAESPDSNFDLRLVAAAGLLAIREDYALKLVEKLTTVGGLEGFSAKMLLREWKKGELREYWG